MEPNKVVQALKVLQDEGREDLLREGVLEEAWVGLRRPKIISSEGVAAAVAACSSPVKSGKKFRVKSAAGRKVARLPEDVDIFGSGVMGQFQAVSKRRGVSSLPRRQGSSLVKHVTAGGRGSAVSAAVAMRSHLGAGNRSAHARLISRKQAHAPLERGAERGVLNLEEEPLAGTSNMAAPIVLDRQFSDVEQTRSGSHVGSDTQTGLVDDEVVVISDEEEEVQEYFSLDVWHSDGGEGPSGCDTAHASGGHGLQAYHRRSGRIAADQSTQVKVRAPSAHRKEVRVKPGAVYLTSGEKFGVADDQPSTSRGAGAGLAVMDEEVLDYDDEFVEPVTSRKNLVLSREMAGEVQGGRPKACGQEVGGLPRGEAGLGGSVGFHESRTYTGGLGGASFLEVGSGLEGHGSKVDASIQVCSAELNGKLAVVSGVRTRCAQFGLWDILSFDGRKSKLHRDILGDNWD
ncbi:hypothetical protein NDU88_007315 [Pleurodeles waltl]|uniref:Uncharacterized protein n=1 Tax=Pleurodeles waltl TaxID=8319 RepID=A0AAV7USJ3_PLEWA|nr:hypothetical protein NDU88_007315 [Pleurodeles waltl]